MRKRISDFQLFIFACLVSLVLVLLGLRGYFSQSQLDVRLGKVIDGKDFVATKGSAKFDKFTHSMRIYADNGQGSSMIIEQLNLTPDWFESVEVHFSDKASLQVLNLSLASQNTSNDKVLWFEQPILYTDKRIGRLAVDSFKDTGQCITAVKLSADKLIFPYGLSAVRFVPKQFDNNAFLSLLWDDLAHNQKSVLISPKLLLVIYFSLVVALFSGLLLWLKRPVAKVWWWVLVAAWLLLDMRYLYQQSQQNWGRAAAVPSDKVASLMIKRDVV